ncbi:MAG TPA: hypothetical protein VMG40_13230 [Bryobacteraceae bacterium]|nr:hypothetical protein [Bryobacteraceae bacterium]
MITKSVLAAGALFLAGFSTAYGQSYEVFIPSQVEAGSVQLAPGSYRISSRGNEAVFTDLNTGKTCETRAMVVQMPAKNPTTRLMYSETGTHIRTIALGGRAIDLQLRG